MSSLPWSLLVRLVFRNPRPLRHVEKSWMMKTYLPWRRIRRATTGHGQICGTWWDASLANITVRWLSSSKGCGSQREFLRMRRKQDSFLSAPMGRRRNLQANQPHFGLWEGGASNNPGKSSGICEVMIVIMELQSSLIRFITPYFTNPKAFCSEVVALEGRAVDVVCLDFSKTFVSHNILTEDCWNMYEISRQWTTVG